MLLICGKKEEKEKICNYSKTWFEKQETIKIKDFIKNMTSNNKLPLN